MISRRAAVIAFLVLFAFSLFSAHEAQHASSRAAGIQRDFDKSVCVLSAKRWSVTHDLAEIVTEPIAILPAQADDALLAARIKARNQQLAGQRAAVLAKLGPMPVCR